MYSVFSYDGPRSDILDSANIILLPHGFPFFELKYN